MSRLFRPRTMGPLRCRRRGHHRRRRLPAAGRQHYCLLVFPRCPGVNAQPKSTSHTNSEAASHEYVACRH